MRNLLVAMMALVLQGQTTGINGETWDNQIYLSTGQTTVLTWDYELLSIPVINSFRIYRQSGAAGAVSQIAEVSSASREYIFTMPGGKVTEFRIRVAAVASNGAVSPASNEFLITRKP